MLVCLLFPPVNLSASQAFLSLFPKSLCCWLPKKKEVQQRQTSPSCSDYEKTSSFSVLFCCKIGNLLPDHWAVLHDPLGPGQTSQVPTQATAELQKCYNPCGEQHQKPVTFLWVLLSRGTLGTNSLVTHTAEHKINSPTDLHPQEMMSPSPLKHASRALQGHQLSIGRNMNNKLFICSQPYHSTSEYTNLCKLCFKA